jgi:hypothetical protein
VYLETNRTTMSDTSLPPEVRAGSGRYLWLDFAAMALFLIGFTYGGHRGRAA